MRCWKPLGEGRESCILLYDDNVPILRLLCGLVIIPRKYGLMLKYGIERMLKDSVQEEEEMVFIGLTHVRV